MQHFSQGLWKGNASRYSLLNTFSKGSSAAKINGQLTWRCKHELQAEKKVCFIVSNNLQKIIENNLKSRTLITLLHSTRIRMCFGWHS